MAKLALIRHGVTDWNRRHIVQGSTDISLDELGRKEVATWIMPPQVKNFDWIASPLKRAIETALILSGYSPKIDDRLSEMSWGDWEGRILSELRDEFGDLMKAWEAEGLDFKGPNGESPREVQCRVLPLFAESAKRKSDTVAVCHKGIIRAIYALATGWSMINKPDDKLQDGCLHLFELDSRGSPSILQLNIDMTA